MIVVLISANSEWRSVVELLDPATRLNSPFGEYFHTQVEGEAVVFFQGGWGKVSAAASTQYAIDNFKPEALINLGTCGGLHGQVKVGEVLLVTDTLYYDIHERMGDPDEAIRFYSAQPHTGEPPYPLQVRLAPLASADEDIDPGKVELLINEFNVAAADWESGAIAWVAKRNGVQCTILRGVTDVVSPAGGEIYNDGAVGFDERAKMIMKTLVDSLPGWIKIIYRGNS
jgi:adenosylhomocysteine nucleosidase